MNSPVANPFSSTDTSINMNLVDLTPEQLSGEDGYIAKKLPDMRIDKSGRIWRANPKIATSFPEMSQEAWDRMMAK